MRIDQITNEATSLQDADRLILTRNSEPLPEDKLKYILGSNLGLGNNLSWVYVRDKKTQNTSGGSFTAGAWQTRDLNDEVYDGENICTLDSNQITLDAGIYLGIIICPAFHVSLHQARLYNTTLSSLILPGNSVYSDSTVASTHSFILGIFTIAESQVLEIQHYCNLTNSSDGFGTAVNAMDEVYTQAIFIKIA